MSNACIPTYTQVNDSVTYKKDFKTWLWNCQLTTACCKSRPSLNSSAPKVGACMWECAVCVYACVSVWYVCACERACMHACMHACVRARVLACVHTCVRACIRACVPAYVRACVRACVHACVRACTRASVCMRACDCVLCETVFVCEREKEYNGMNLSFPNLRPILTAEFSQLALTSTQQSHILSLITIKIRKMAVVA